MNMKPPVAAPIGTHQRHAPGTPEPPFTPPTSAKHEQAPRMFDSSALLGDQALVLIRHQGETYRLQTTRQGKLILTK